MNVEPQPDSSLNNTNRNEDERSPEKELKTPTKEKPAHKFVWDSRTMMPDVIATRAKAIAIQAREEAAGRRVSYSKIWIKEFLKLHPNCPYTTNNLSVHYWYWNSRENGGGGGSAEKNKEAAGHRKSAAAEGLPRGEQQQQQQGEEEQRLFWSEARLDELGRLVARVEQQQLGGPKCRAAGRTRDELVAGEWARRYPSCREDGSALIAILHRNGRLSASKHKQRWNPQLNKVCTAVSVVKTLIPELMIHG